MKWYFWDLSNEINLIPLNQLIPLSVIPLSGAHSIYNNLRMLKFQYPALKLRVKHKHLIC